MNPKVLEISAERQFLIYLTPTITVRSTAIIIPAELRGLRAESYHQVPDKKYGPRYERRTLHYLRRSAAQESAACWLSQNRQSKGRELNVTLMALSSRG